MNYSSLKRNNYSWAEEMINAVQSFFALTNSMEQSPWEAKSTFS
jgi:hypothetical protein